MNILVLNSGSSSIKCCLYHFSEPPKQNVAPLWEAHLQWKNHFEETSLKIKNERGEVYSENIKASSPREALKYLMESLWQGKGAVLSSPEEIDGIGHRIVHGGKDYQKSIVIDAKVKEKIRKLSDLAPLHNLADLEGIEAVETLFKHKPQIAVFDTAFHHTLPKSASVYPCPYKWYEEGIKRYGFHGISFQYCTRRASELLHKNLNHLKMVICHLGSGASLCAIKDGKSIDTTMGFTPLEGLMMDTRSGSIDPGMILYLLKSKKKTVEELNEELYYQSGLLGLSGISSDMRDIIEKSLKNDAHATLALEVYLHRLNNQIGSMIASLKGIDVLVFTAGIGENAALVRKKVCDTFSFLGARIDDTKNNSFHKEDINLSASNSGINILLIHTQEAFEIARECWNLLI